MIDLKVATVGSSYDVALPKSAAAKSILAKGETHYLQDAPDVRIRIILQDRNFSRRSGIIGDIIVDRREIVAAFVK